MWPVEAEMGSIRDRWSEQPTPQTLLAPSEVRLEEEVGRISMRFAIGVPGGYNELEGRSV